MCHIQREKEARIEEMKTKSPQFVSEGLKKEITSHK